MINAAALAVLFFLFAAEGHAAPQPAHLDSTNPATPGELRELLLGRLPDVDRFRSRGPFAVTVRKDHELRLSRTERYKADLYITASAEKAPLVVLLHGQGKLKEDHSRQGFHLASWGMDCLVIQLPNSGHWIGNGKTLARIVTAIQRTPQIADPQIDAARIVLAGHSFGGTAVAIALASGAPAVGGVLLDPAGTGFTLPRYLRLLRKPVMVLGADEELFEARNRDCFFRYIPSAVGEVSIKDATHADATFPSGSTAPVSTDPTATEQMQLTFLSALTSAAFSLLTTGNFDYAWESYAIVLKDGRFFDARRK
jgi:acetyl esterase/lipase